MLYVTNTSALRAPAKWPNAAKWVPAAPLRTDCCKLPKSNAKMDHRPQQAPQSRYPCGFQGVGFRRPDFVNGIETICRLDQLTEVL